MIEIEQLCKTIGIIKAICFSYGMVFQRKHVKIALALNHHYQKVMKNSIKKSFLRSIAFQIVT
ncbi:MAG: hypothetical protein B7Y15_10290 [Bacteroidetes bacterium 24-39-8]|nr:MAG: hypothetical protein B7Y15_10290 [Bacteroidetes bacterium 24-39-8]